MPQLSTVSVTALIAGGQISTLLSVIDDQADDLHDRQVLGGDNWCSECNFGEVRVSVLNLNDGVRLIDIQHGRDFRSFRCDKGRAVAMPTGMSAGIEIERLRRIRKPETLH